MTIRELGGAAWRGLISRSGEPAAPSLARSPIEGLQKWLVPIGFVLVWQAACALGFVSDTVLPPPTTVLKTAWNMTLTGELPAAMGVSFLRAMAGFVVGGGIGLPSASRTACRP